MGSTAKKEDVKLRLVRTARTLFADKGYHAVGIREIARKARINSSLISYYFGGKHGLYKAVLSDYFVGHAEVMRELDRTSLSPREKLFRAFDVFSSRHEITETFMMVAKSKLLKGSRISDLGIGPVFKILYDTSVKLIAGGVIKPRYKDLISPHRMMYLIVAMINYWRLFPSTLLEFGAHKDYEDIDTDIQAFIKGLIKEFVIDDE